jgi:betaine reductase
MVVLLGTPNAESTRLYALTVTAGDPSWAGALAGVGLGLPVYHITEDAVKHQITPQAYEEHVSLMEVVLDIEAIARATQEVRTSVGQHTA